jgi:hypothetical protein
MKKLQGGKYIHVAITRKKAREMVGGRGTNAQEDEKRLRAAGGTSA